MKVAVVNDWLMKYGGAERVLTQMLMCYPDADIFSLVDFLPQEQREYIFNKPVRTSFIQHLPFARTKYRKYLPLMPMAIEQFQFHEYDLVISSSHAVAKGVITTPDQFHVCYLQARNLKYAYEDRIFYPTRSLLRHVEDYFLTKLRVWDSVASRRPDLTIANSGYVRDWQKRRHGIEATVIFPPVETDLFVKSYSEAKENYYITVGRLEPYKRFDVVVQGFTKLGKRLVVVGSGTEEARLRALAGNNVQFVGYRSAEEVAGLLTRARAFVYSGCEDFGIVFVEAQACGTPVITLGKGGALENVCGPRARHPTGLFFEEQHADSLAAAVETFERTSDAIRPEACRDNALRFSSARFRAEFTSLTESAMRKFRAVDSFACSASAS